MEDSIDEKCLYSSFNQDSSLFCVGTNKGFRVYSSYPFKCVGKRDISGGIGIVEILNRCIVNHDEINKTYIYTQWIIK